MLEIMITSSVLILALVLFRRLCWGKISRRLQYGLWILVLVRLLVPAQFLTSPFSIMNIWEHAKDAEYVREQQISREEVLPNSEKQLGTDETYIKEEPTATEVLKAPDLSHMTNPYITEASGSVHTAVKVDREATLRMALFGVYLAGVVLSGGCILWCNINFRRRLVRDRQFIGREGRVKIYWTSHVSSPCLYGVFKPGVYMTEQALLSEERKEHTLIHEMTHYRHLDHIWAVVRTLCLVLYWFHPLVWVAARLSMEDSELACDEGTLALLGEEKREAYGHTLIEMTIERTKSHRLLYCATDMVNGKEEIKKRITAIAFYKKPMIWVAVIVIVFAGVLAACTASGTKDSEQDEVQGETVVTAEVSSETAGTSEMQEEGEQASETLEGIKINEDGSFRLSEYEVELTGDKIKDRIVFDVFYWADLGDDMSKVTTKTLWEKLWIGTEVLVRILEGQEETDADTPAEDVILYEYSFSEAHAGNGNLAVVRHEKKNCILLYSNLMYQGSGSLGYKLLQIMPSGTEPVLLEEDSASYWDGYLKENDQAIVDKVLEVGERLDDYLTAYDTKILLNASVSGREDCYLHGSEEGLLNGVRRQNVLQLFFTETGGSGLELKLSDFFYPEGMEPITKLPEDAEARVLGGELLCMEVTPENSTAGRLDLNGDGQKEVLYLEALGSYFNDAGWDAGIFDSRYRVRINRSYYIEQYGDRVYAELMVYSPNGKDILLAVYDDGPSNDPKTSFFRYDGSGLYPAGSIPADIRDATLEEGIIKCTFRADMMQTEWAWGYYYWNGSEIVRREDDIYYMVDDSSWREQAEMPLLLLREITVFAERSEESEAITLKPQKVRNVATDNSEWILLEGEDGTGGWIRITGFGNFPSEEADCFELFENLNMAD